MRTTLKLRVPYPAPADAGDALQIYTDRGTGTVDTTKGLLQAPAGLFPGVLQRFGGFGSEVFGESDAETGFALPPAPLGFGSETFGDTPFGDALAYREVAVHVPPSFGVHKFNARLVDEAGNPQGDAMPLGEFMVSSEEPPSLKSFAFDSYNDVDDVVTFTFTKNTE